jgi:hypothetical protein
LSKKNTVFNENLGIPQNTQNIHENIVNTIWLRGLKMQKRLGATRLVFLFKNFVIKIPNLNEYKLFLNGILANLQEKVFSKMNRPDLAKVMFCGKLGLFLVMERAEEIDCKSINWNEFKEQLEKNYKNDEMKEFMLSDPKPSNWGYINGKLVKVDYGD